MHCNLTFSSSNLNEYAVMLSMVFYHFEVNDAHIVYDFGAHSNLWLFSFFYDEPNLERLRYRFC